MSYAKWELLNDDDMYTEWFDGDRELNYKDFKAKAWDNLQESMADC